MVTPLTFPLHRPAGVWSSWKCLSVCTEWTSAETSHVRRLLQRDCLQKFLLIYNSCIQKQKAQHGWETTTASCRITCFRAADWSTAPRALPAASCICFQRDRKNINVSLRVVKCQPRAAFTLCHREVGTEWKLDEMSDRMKENKRANTKSPVSALKADIWPGVRALRWADSKCRKNMKYVKKTREKKTKDFSVKFKKIQFDRDGEWNESPLLWNRDCLQIRRFNLIYWE